LGGSDGFDSKPIGYVFVIPSLDLWSNLRKMADPVLIKKPIKIDRNRFFE